MPIISSVVTAGHAQVDGRRYVREVHTWDDGTVMPVEYGPIATEGLDLQVIANARAARIVLYAADAECDEVTRRADVTLKRQTGAEFMARFWGRVERAQVEGDRVEKYRLIWWLIERLNDASITDAQARVTFNAAFSRSLSAAQWTTYKTSRLIPVHDRYAALLDEADL